MAIKLLKNVNFGSSKGGLGTVGFTLVGYGGETVTGRSTTGVHEVGTSTGIYAAPITFSSLFSGSILWDTGEAALLAVYATEEYNQTEDKLNFIKGISGGRWKLDQTTKQMVFYDDDNTTIVARFSMYNSSKNSSVDSVHQRVRNDENTDGAVLIGNVDP